jgi:hypothetical protein
MGNTPISLHPWLASAQASLHKGSAISFGRSYRLGEATGIAKTYIIIAKGPKKTVPTTEQVPPHTLNGCCPDIQLSRRGQHEGNEYLLRKLSLQQSTIWADDALLSEARVRMRSGNVISAHVSRKRSL